MTLTTHLPGLSANFKQLTFSCHDWLPLQPNVLWQIERGAVRTFTWSDEGTVVTLGYWGAGDVVGHALSRIQPHQIECITSVEASCIPYHRWHQALDAIVCHVQQTEEILTIVRHERVYLRLQQFLVWLADKFGRSVRSGELIDLRITHQAIAETIGTTRVTVTRLLREFEQKGIILRQQRYIILRDRPNALSK